MTLRAVWVFAAALVAGVSVPAPALACACCADSGFRYESRSAITAYEKTQLAQLAFAATAHVYRSDADDSAKGLGSDASDLRLEHTRKGASWTFKLTDAHGKTGTLAFQLPKNMERFAVDPQDGTNSPGGGPILYKEWKLSAPVTGTGFLRAGAGKGASVKLVLQGHGNACDDATMYTHFMLVVSGPRAEYTLYGGLSSATP